MPLAICVKATRHYNVGNIVEVPSLDHPFIISGDFEIIVPKKILKKSKPIIKKKGRR